MFNLRHLQEVSSKVLLYDPTGNIFQVAVEIRNEEAFFTHGWSAVGKFYGLILGGWARVVFTGSDIFLMQLRDRLDQQVQYPSPVKFSRIDTPPMVIGDFQRHAVTNHCGQICRKPGIFFVIEKDLTKKDLTSGFLVSILY